MYILFFIALVLILSGIKREYIYEGYKEGKGGAAAAASGGGKGGKKGPC